MPLIVVIVHAHTGRFCPMLRDISHLLLLSQHLYLHLLLLRQGHEVVEDVTATITVHIFCVVLKFSPIRRAVSLVHVIVTAVLPTRQVVCIGSCPSDRSRTAA